jgi:hypothetical protein
MTKKTIRRGKPINPDKQNFGMLPTFLPTLSKSLRKNTTKKGGNVGAQVRFRGEAPNLRANILFPLVFSPVLSKGRILATISGTLRATKQFRAERSSDLSQ